MLALQDRHGFFLLPDHLGVLADLLCCPELLLRKGFPREVEIFVQVVYNLLLVLGLYRKFSNLQLKLVDRGVLVNQSRI